MKGLTNAPSEHGLYELWVNPNPTGSFNPQTITIDDFDSNKWDAIEIEWATVPSETMGTKVKRYEKSALVNGSLSSISEISMWISTTLGRIYESGRTFNISVVGTTLSITFGNAIQYTVSAIGTQPASETANDREIPVRILGLAHND